MFNIQICHIPKWTDEMRHYDLSFIKKIMKLYNLKFISLTQTYMFFLDVLCNLSKQQLMIPYSGYTTVMLTKVKNLCFFSFKTLGTYFLAKDDALGIIISV